jgi:2-methylisocitrate lyase-like PEP mutase family enzyme
MPSQQEKAAQFARMHQAGCFILPNAWDMGSAALIAEAGFKAMATTSAGVAFAYGFPDGEFISRDRMLEICGEIAQRMPIPVTADLEAGYGTEPGAVAETVRRAIAAGIVGCNIEDAAQGKLFDFDLSVARIKAGVDAAKAAGLPDFVLNARTDPYLKKFGTPEQCFDESVRRANAYLAVGAKCAFIPGPSDAATATRLAQAVKGPINLSGVLAGALPPLAEMKKTGVRRISLGGSLMQASYGFLRTTMKKLATDAATFDYAKDSVGHAEFGALMQKYKA